MNLLQMTAVLINLILGLCLVKFWPLVDSFQVASFGAHLMDYNILTMSIAPSDKHEAQLQFALERGVPAMLGILSIHRLPFPSRSFDMAHCARCLVPWTKYGTHNRFYSLLCVYHYNVK